MKKVWIAVAVSALTLTLTACGHEHTWTEATCTEPKKCSECGATEGEALGHKWIEATCTSPKTCEICGETEGDPLGHAVDVGLCSRCGKIANEQLLNEIVGYFDKASEAGNKAISIVDGADTSSLSQMYSSITSAQKQLDTVKTNMQSMYDACGDYEGLSSLKSQADKVIKAIPGNPKGSDKDSIVSWLQDYASLLKTMSNAFAEMASYAAELSKAQ